MFCGHCLMTGSFDSSHRPPIAQNGISSDQDAGIRKFLRLAARMEDLQSLLWNISKLYETSSPLLCCSIVVTQDNGTTTNTLSSCNAHKCFPSATGEYYDARPSLIVGSEHGVKRLLLIIPKPFIRSESIRYCFWIILFVSCHKHSITCVPIEVILLQEWVTFLPCLTTHILNLSFSLSDMKAMRQLNSFTILLHNHLFIFFIFH
mmetsp:Transcript_20596/g.26802  ORF Transcript_20596/g.26802 Transcript_20596/m.26802 type:complete len:205 (-) Transcript_20596:65-679(-)